MSLRAVARSGVRRLVPGMHLFVVRPGTNRNVTTALSCLSPPIRVTGRFKRYQDQALGSAGVCVSPEEAHTEEPGW
jgi:hypothetical protein